MPRLSRALHARLAAGEINRREANHMQWEEDNPTGARNAKGREALRQGAAKQGRARIGFRVRNNRREY